MRFELNSQYRDRNNYPNCGHFQTFINRKTKNKKDALDPVCLSSPMISWKGGFTINCTVVSYQPINPKFTIILLSSPLFNNAQSEIVDFYSGCELTSPTPMRTVIRYSEKISTDILRVTTDTYISFIDVSNPLILTDFTNYQYNHIRSPTNFDLGLYKYLYNENLNEYTRIENSDLNSRVLRVLDPTTTWNNSHNVNIRSELPIENMVLLGCTLNSITIPIFLDPENNEGDWIRIRSLDYSTTIENNVVKRKIIKIVGQVLYLEPKFDILPVVGSIVELLNFSFDNAFPLQTYDVTKRLPFQTSLETIYLPNIKLKNDNVNDAPYFYLSVDNTQAPITNKYQINSNNINVQDGMWTIEKVQNFNTDNKNTQSKYYSCKTTNNPQPLIINVDEGLTVKLIGKNGILFQPSIEENKSPQQTWPELNFSIIINFEFEKNIVASIEKYRQN